MIDLPPPSVTFASDNAAGVHPVVMEALATANHGHAIAYGADPWTERLAPELSERFDTRVEALPVWGGTGANVVSLACLAQTSDAVICTEHAHIHVDEAGAPERMAGCKLIALPALDGKLRPEQLREHTAWLGDEHHPQPRVLSITQSTELGTLYSADEIRALCEAAHAHGMVVHVDGARIANAAAALGGDLASFTTAVGVDVVSFGATKNGLMYGEVVVFLDPDAVPRARHVRKQLAQLPSKTRFVSAQVLALLADDLWLELARHANAMTARLADAVAAVPGLVLERPAVVNSLFPILPADAIEELASWCHFYTWDAALHQVRWMTAWDTSEDDVDRFAAGVRSVLDGAT